jgi:hypothetical protein
MYSIGVMDSAERKDTDFDLRRSFWSKDESDDLASQDNSTSPFWSISPPAPNFALNNITSPREFVSLLLGGNRNRWANVDMASAFATCVTGHPVIANIVKNRQSIEPLPGRDRFPEIAARVRPGLAAVVTEGTARQNLQSTGALTMLASLPGVKVYAKTGTLRPKGGARNTSRLVLSIVRWQDERRGLAQSGLVFSLVIEEADVGVATRWLGEFLVQNRSDVERLLRSESQK